MKTIEIRGHEHDNANDALTELNFSGDRAIRIAGRFFTVDMDEAHRLEAEGISFAYLNDHEMPDGQWRIITVPVN